VAVLKKSLHIIDFLSGFFGKVFSFLIPIMVVLQFGEVILRYVFNSPTTWSWELCAYLFGANFLMGGAWVLKERRHVRTDMFYDRLTPRRKALLDLILFGTVFMVFAIVLTYTTTKQAIFSISILEKSYTMWSAPLYPLKAIIALSFILLSLQGIAKIIRDFILVVRGEEI